MAAVKLPSEAPPVAPSPSVPAERGGYGARLFDRDAGHRRRSLHGRPVHRPGHPAWRRADRRRQRPERRFDARGLRHRRDAHIDQRAAHRSATTFDRVPPPMTPTLIVVPRAGSASGSTASDLSRELVDRAGARAPDRAPRATETPVTSIRNSPTPLRDGLDSAAGKRGLEHEHGVRPARLGLDQRP